MVTLARRAARTPLAPVVAVMFGLVAAILVAAVPGWMFNQAVQDSGLPAVLPYAAPPLGLTARIVASGSAFILTALVLWIVLSPLEKLVKKNKRSRTAWQDQGYVAADEPVKVEGRRRPIFAPAELGAPLMSDEAIASVPVAEPVPEIETDSELEAPLRIVEFDLPPEETSDADHIDADLGEDAARIEPEQEDNSIQALIRRLETGLARRAANDPGPGSPASAPSSYDSETPESRPPLSLSKDWVVPGTPSIDDETRDDIRQALGALSRFASR